MKAILVGFMLVAALGCKKDQPRTTPAPVTQAPASPTPAPTPTPSADLSSNQAVSPGVSVSSDIAQACGIQTPKQAAPRFDYDDDELTAEDRDVLNKVATCLTAGALKGRSVQLVGRADPRGTDEYNLGLGSRRANTVNTYLENLGVGSAQLQVTTRGSLDASGTDESGWQQDRRVDIMLQPQA